MHRFTSPGYLQRYLLDNGLVNYTGTVIQQCDGGVTVDVEGIKFWVQNELIPYMEEYLTLKPYMASSDNVKTEELISTESLLDMKDTEESKEAYRQFKRVETIHHDEDGTVFEMLNEDSMGEYYFIPIIPNDGKVKLGIYPTFKDEFLGELHISIKYNEEYKMFVLDAIWFKELEGELYQTGYESVTVNSNEIINVCSNGCIVIASEEITRKKYAI